MEVQYSFCIIHNYHTQLQHRTHTQSWITPMSHAMYMYSRIYNLAETSHTHLNAAPMSQRHITNTVQYAFMSKINILDKSPIFYHGTNKYKRYSRISLISQIHITNTIKYASHINIYIQQVQSLHSCHRFRFSFTGCGVIEI